MKNLTKLQVLVASCLLIAVATQASAQTINWADWTSNTSATLPGNTVTYSNTDGSSYLVTDYPSWGPASSYADGLVITNPPPSGNNIVQIFGGNTDLETITFSQAITNPVFAIWSLGSSGTTASFVFNQTPTFVAGGPSNEYTGSAIVVSGNTVSGAEGNGTIQFLGTFSSISWTNPTYENWYGFTVGAPVPEPGSYALMVAGLAFVGVLVRRRRTKQQ
jgi:hypothetical protein